MAKYQINFSEFEELCNGSKDEMLATIDRIKNGNMNSGDQMVYAELNLEDYTKEELNEALSLLETQIYDYVEMNIKEETTMTTRTIALEDCWDSELLVATNAPSDEIKNAIDYLNKLREGDIPDPHPDSDEIFSDFEEIQQYLRAKGYTFAEIGSIKVTERYHW